MNIYLLWHTHVSEKLAQGEDSKLIGVYSSYQKAIEAQTRAGALPGFVEHKEGFEISEQIIDKDSWTSGFVTV